MRIENGAFWIDLPHDLVDEALVTAAQSAPEELRRQFLEEREAVNSIEIVDIREESFRLLDARWAERLRLGGPLLEAVGERVGLSERISGCVVERVRADADEKATLRPDGDGVRQILRLTVKLDTVLSRSRLSDLLAGLP